MCVVCRKISENSVSPREAENLLEEIQEKISEQHLEEVEDKIADYYDTYDYGLDAYEEDAYDDELGADEKQMIREYAGDNGYDFDDIPDFDDGY